MSPRQARRVSLRNIAWGVLAILFMTVVSTAEAILRHPVGQAAAVTLLPVVAYLLGRWQGRRARPDDHAQLRHENRALKAKCKTLADMINGPVVRP